VRKLNNNPQLGINERIRRFTRENLNIQLDSIKFCDKHQHPLLGEECLYCLEDKRERGGNNYWSEERIKIENLARQHFNSLNLARNEITSFLKEKGKIKTVHYDFETSNIDEKQGWVIFWYAKCCHGLVENGADIKSWMNLINALEKQENQVVIQAHNGIRFDFSFYWNEIIKEHLLSKTRENQIREQLSKIDGFADS
jgi:hypothetical protein